MVQYAIDNGLISDDESDDEDARASQIDCTVELSANTVEAMFGVEEDEDAFEDVGRGE